MPNFFLTSIDGVCGAALQREQRTAAIVVYFYEA